MRPVDQLIGSTLLGRFSIDMMNVASIEPLSARQPKTEVLEMRVTGLTVTDRKGVSVNLKIQNGFETPWLTLGAGSVTIPYDRISRLEIKSIESGGSGSLMMGVDIDGQGRMQFGFSPTSDLQGESNLGLFSISWAQVAHIVTNREKVVKK